MKRCRFENGLIRVPGTKTEESECYLPASPALQDELKSYLANHSDESSLLFPGRSAQTKGKKIYSLRRLVAKIRRVTAFKAYTEKNPSTPALNAWKELKQQGYPDGIKLTTEGPSRLLCDPGISTSYRPEYGQKLNATHQPKHYEPLHQNSDGAHEISSAKFG